MTVPDTAYPGKELELFSVATRWKAYWAQAIAPYLSGRVLEVGAGIGANTRHLLSLAPRSIWTAIEPDDSLRSSLEKVAFPLGSKVRVLGGTSARLDPSERFDTILYIDVLEHIENDSGELQTVARHLAPGGHLIVLAPAHSWLMSEFDRSIGHYRRYNRRTLRAAAPKTLKPVRFFYLDAVGVMASLANRLLLRSSYPTPAQIQIWDRLIVRTSQLIDPLLGYQLGKTVIGIWRQGSHNPS